MKGARCRAALAVALVAALASFTPAVARDYSAAEIKAEFIERFTRFVDWPAAKNSDWPAVFRLCVVGASPVTEHLREIARSRTFQGRRAVVVTMEADEVSGRCRVVYVGSSSEPTHRAVAARTLGMPVLTIGEGSRAVGHGLIMGLYISAGRLRFDVDVAAADANGLHVRSKLVRLAERVRGSGRTR